MLCDDLFWLSDLVCPLFFLNAATIFFYFIREVTPWRVSPGAVRHADASVQNNSALNFVRFLWTTLYLFFSFKVTFFVLVSV